MLSCMNTSLTTLAYLSKHPDVYVSGQTLADELGISRSAVWKAIETLRDEGHLIDAITNKGYCLIRTSKILDKGKLEALLPQLPIYLFDTLDSTNRYAKQLEGEAPALVVASAQSGGKGRLGRTFVSPKGGAYFSLVVHPSCKAEDAALITSASAVAVAEAIEEVCSLSCGIKWVNDVFLGNKKICGILTEGVMDVETGALSFLVAGIGINFATAQKAFDPSLRNLVTSLYDGQQNVPPHIDASVLVASVVKKLLYYHETLSSRSFLPEYRRRSIVLGKQVMVVQQKKQEQALVLGIDDNAHLQVRFADGREETLFSGEISIRLEV